MPDETNPVETPEPRRRRRWPRRLLVLFLLLAVLAVGTRALLPLALQRGAEYAARRYAGLEVRVDNVDLWLLDGGIALEGVTVDTPTAAPEGSPHEALLKWKRLYGLLDWKALLDSRVHLKKVSLARPAVSLRELADGGIALPPLGAAEETPAQEPAPNDDTTSAWPISVDELSFENVRVRITAASGELHPVEFTLEELLLNRLAIEGNDVDVGSVALRAPALRLRRSFLIPSPSAETAAPAEAKAPEKGAGPLDALAPYRIDDIVVERAAFTLLTEDRALDMALGFKASGVTAAVNMRFPVELQLDLEDGSLTVGGEVGLNPPAYEGKVAWTDLPVPPVSFASNPEIAAWIQSCHASGDLDVLVRTAAGEGAEASPMVRLSGRTTVKDLAVEDPETQELAFGWKEFEIVLKEASIFLASADAPGAPPKIALESVRLVDPMLRYTRPSDAVDRLLALLGGGPAEAPAEAAAVEDTHESPPTEVSIASLGLSGGSLEIVDRGVSPTYTARVRDFGVAATDIAMPARRARDVHVSGTIPKKSTFDIKGGIDGETGDFKFALDRFNLVPLNPYVTPASGYSFGRGRLSLDSELELRGTSVKADNDIVLHKLDIDTADESNFEKQFGISIDLALALLRDTNGDIELPVRIKAGADGVRTGLGKTVRAALRRAVQGALASPLKLAGGLLGGKDGETTVEPLAAIPGHAELEPKQEERLGPLAKLLESRPLLAVVLSGRAGKPDRPTLAEAVLAERLQAGKDLPKIESAGWFDRGRVEKVLAAKQEGKDLNAEDQALLDAYVKAVKVSRKRMQELARQRVEFVRARLTQEYGVPEAAIQIDDAFEEGHPGVFVELGVRQSAPATP